MSDKMSYKYPGWDIMFRRKKQEMMYGDFATNKLLNRGIYSVYKPDMNDEKRIFKRREHPILTGIWYVFILSCLLWWLPLFGQMIAGYIGGRKAGTPMKGVLVAVIPVFFIFLLFIGMDQGYFPFLMSIVSIPHNLMTGVQNLSPQAASYLSGIYSSLKTVVGLDGNGFFIILVFGFIGGIMADMNKKEIVHASGNQNFYDALFERFSGAGLSKFADMVAERVFWTLSSIDHGSRNLIGRMHNKPNAIGFENLQKVPTTPSTFALPAHDNEPPSYQPERAINYDAYDTYNAYSSQQGEFEKMKKIAPNTSSQRIYPRNERNDYLEDDWGIDHRDLSEESLTKAWKKHNSVIGRGKKGQRYRRDGNNYTEKLNSKKNLTRSRPRDKREALIYDNEGNQLNKSEEKRKNNLKFPKRKVPPLISRALSADEEIKAKEKMEKQTIPQDEKDRKEIGRSKPSHLYDRL
jgi:hypothetical protein